MVDVDEQGWAREFPIGAGGKLFPEWLEQRKEWLDHIGRPFKPEWDEQSVAVNAQQERERTYCDEYEKEHDIYIVADEQELFDAHQIELVQHPKRKEKHDCRKPFSPDGS